MKLADVLPLEEVAAGAAARDADTAGAFPEDAIALLERAGALTGDVAFAEELDLVRAVARADAGIARILDGHLNAVERLRIQAPAELAERELAAVANGTLRAGVWGADPGSGEGEPAALHGSSISGVKTFCSGAGGLDRALVLVRDERDHGPPLAAWVDLTASETIDVDRRWFRGAGMRSSASHRVIFDGTPVLGILGPPGALTQQPWFARDAVRTAATWAGACDTAVADTFRLLAHRADRELEALAAGRLLTWQRGLGLWLDEAARVLDGDDPPAGAQAAAIAAQARAAIADAARAILDEAERATGSRPPATGAALDRAARDLRLFLLQHRLEPIVAAAGRVALGELR